MMHEDLRRTWRKYRDTIFPTSTTIRSGHAIYEEFGKKDLADDQMVGYDACGRIFVNRFESVAEHSFHTALLTMACLEGKLGSMLFHDCEFDSEDELHTDVYVLRARVVCYQLLHDIGEIKTGSVRKDGRVMSHRVVGEQHETYEDTVDYFFRDSSEIDDKRKLLEWRSYNYFGADFESKENAPAPVLKAIGDLETVLKVAVLELCGLRGDVAEKAKKSKVIKKTVEITGTTDALDNFAAYFKLNTMKTLDEIQQEALYGILETAVKDVRGKWFDWWLKIKP